MDLANSPVVAFAGRYWRILVYRRVLGLSAEGAFWLVFSLPWLLLGAVSIIGLVDHLLPTSSIAQVQEAILEWAERWLTPEVTTDYVEPIVTGIFSRGSAGISTVSFLVALWSGSRCIQTFVEANMIVNNQFRGRGYLRLRGLSVGILLALAGIAAVVAPVYAFGAKVAEDEFAGWGVLVTGVWLLFSLALVVAVLTGMLHASLKVRPSILSSVPGALLMLVGWWAGGVFLGYYLARVFDDTSVYGVLAAPIAIMLYAFAIAMMAFLGAALNAALRGVDAGPRVDDAQLTPGGSLGEVAAPEPAHSSST